MVSGEIKKLQQKELDILKEVIKICNRHNLRWFAIGGTMLGAIRHKGFIPWDDDIDIGMPREDYNKLIKYAQEELPEHLEVLTGVKGYDFLFMKIHDKTTTFLEEACKGKKEWYKGVFIDIMPFDGVPSNLLVKKLYYIMMRQLVKIYDYRKFGKISGKSIKVQLINYFSTELLHKVWMKLATNWSFYSSKQTCFTWSIRNKKLTFDTALFDDLIEVQFEDICVRVPRNYKKYLTQHYGDFMKIPPENERQIHNAGGIVDVYKSYNYYLGEMKIW